MKLTIPSKQKNAGLTLIEVLVSLMVLAIGLLGLAMLQAAGLRFTNDSYSRSQATLFAYDIIERMRSNPTGFTAGNYDIANVTAANTAISTYSTCKSSGCSCETTTCTSATLAQYDLGRWYDQQDKLLAGAQLAANQSKRATIVRAGNAVTITLYWIEQNDLKSQVWQAEFGS